MIEKTRRPSALACVLGTDRNAGLIHVAVTPIPVFPPLPLICALPSDLTAVSLLPVTAPPLSFSIVPLMIVAVLLIVVSSFTCATTIVSALRFHNRQQGTRDDYSNQQSPHERSILHFLVIRGTRVCILSELIVMDVLTPVGPRYC